MGTAGAEWARRCASSIANSGCTSVYLVNTGTSSQAIVSAAARLLEHLASEGLLDESVCLFFASTPQSLEAAQEARERLGGLYRGLGVKFLLDREACKASLYEGILLDPIEAYEALRGALQGVDVLGVDITGGTKAHVFVASNLAWYLARRREVRVSYTPGEAFTTPSIVKPPGDISVSRFGGWWGGKAYPYTPRSLQRLFISKLPSMELQRGGCKPLHAPPKRIPYTPVTSPQTLDDAVAEATRLINAVTCSDVELSLCHGRRQGGCVKLLRGSWSGPRINRAIRYDDERRLDSLVEIYASRGNQSVDKIRDCIGKLIKLVTSAPKVAECSQELRHTLPACRAVWLHEVLAEAAATGTRRTGALRLLVDTSALLAGFVPAVKLAETLLALQGRSRVASSVEPYVHPCVLEEIENWLTEYAKPAYGDRVNPCTGYAVAARLHAARLRPVETHGGGRSCDTAQIEHAAREGLVLVTADGGLAYTASLHGASYIHVEPASLWQAKGVESHAAAATMAQMVALLAAAAGGGTYLLLEGDAGAAKLSTTSHGDGARIELWVGA